MHLMFFQSIMSEMLYLVSCLHDRKKIEEIGHFSLRACSFYYECIANLRNCILNIDHLEMKQVQISSRSIV